MNLLASRLSHVLGLCFPRTTKRAAGMAACRKFSNYNGPSD